MKSKVALQGAEIEAHLQKEGVVKGKEPAHQAVMAHNQWMLEVDEDESDSDSDSDEDQVEQVLGNDLMDISGGADEDGDNHAGGRRKGDKSGDRVDWTMDGDEGLMKQLLSYHIYLKGNVLRVTSFFKSAGGQTQ